MHWLNCIFVSSLIVFLSHTAHAFQPSPISGRVSAATKRVSTRLRDTSQVVQIIEEQYPIFMKLVLSKNSDVWKKLSDVSSAGYTIFAPNDEAMRALGEKKLSQLDDVRNGETAEKIASYHAIDERVTADELFNSAGVITLGGVIDVGRTKVGGFMGFGGEEDGGVTINGARIVQSLEVGKSLIHEVDAMVSPELLWRYLDQLRIPGSK